MDRLRSKLDDKFYSYNLQNNYSRPVCVLLYRFFLIVAESAAKGEGSGAGGWEALAEDFTQSAVYREQLVRRRPSVCVRPSYRPSVCVRPSLRTTSVRPSVHPFIRPSVHPYVRPSVR